MQATFLLFIRDNLNILLHNIELLINSIKFKERCTLDVA